MSKKEISTRMISPLIIVMALIATAGGVCEDNLVPLEAENLPAVWNIGTVPHVFFNSRHLRGVTSVSDMKILGLDTAKTSLQFCPADMTIYGNLTARRIQFLGGYLSNVDYIHDGSQTFAHGDGQFNLTLTDFQMKNIVAPLRYSRATKRLQLEEMQYEVTEEQMKQKVTGFQTDGEGSHVVDDEEFVKIDQSNSFPSSIEFMRALINSKAPKGILFTAAKQVFGGALSL